MKGDAMEKLGQYHRMATVICYGMIGTLLVFAAMVETLKATNYGWPGNVFSYSVLELLRYVFLGVAILEFFVIKVMRRAILSWGGRISGLPNRGDPLSTKVQRLFTAAIVTFAFCESVGIYGLVLFLIGGSSFDFYLFLFLSLVFFALYFPRYSQWEEWAKSN